jgi:cephalosporin hydroxylase
MVVKPNYTGHRKDVATLEGYWKVWKAMHIYPRKILELGVDKGGSLLLWNDMFAPMYVVGMDIDISDEYLQQIDATFDAIQLYQFDQFEPGSLRKSVPHMNYDLIIDDCSHHVKHAFESMCDLWDWMNIGGAYVIEDWKAFEEEQAEERVRQAIAALDSTAMGIGSIIITHALIGFIRDG